LEQLSALSSVSLQNISAVDDVVIKAISEQCHELKQIFLMGSLKVTDQGIVTLPSQIQVCSDVS
jgi:uncharacterized protein YbaP (TraB family)